MNQRNTQTITIAEAKGRPMLHWVGKRPLDHVTAFPAQRIETFNPALPSPTGRGAGGEGLLFHGDNKDVLAWLLAHGYRGKVNLIYIDPPFDSGADYVRQVKLRGISLNNKIEGEAHVLGEQIQYIDIWSNDTYLQFMYERLILLSELLAENGSIYLHCDPRRSHHLRCLMDEVFSSENFRSEIVWKRADAHSSADRYGPIHDNLLYYGAGENPIWNIIRTGVKESTADQWYTNEEILDKAIVNQLGQSLPTGYTRRYNQADLSAPGSREGTRAHYEWRGHYPPPGRHWAYMREEMERLEEEGRIVYSSSGKPYEKRYLDETEGAPLQDIWVDIQQLRGMQLTFRASVYPTEKPESLVERIIQASSNPGDLVLDCFCGSGTTPAVAQKLGRRWIAADINKGAIQTTSKRLQTIIRDQLAANAPPRQPSLDLSTEQPATSNQQPASLAFSVYRVNDYDLQIQHNEAVALAVEHIGIERMKTDTYFEGTLGKKLVKIIPFNHPLTLLDLQSLVDELAARPNEDRDVTIVCLGKETTVDPWLEDYNRRHPVNKIDLIELRTDQKYGKFLVHQPAQADVTVKRENGKLIVDIEDFLSPTIVERLAMDMPLFKATITDWRAMVDCVMIDTAYSGEIFNIVLSDVPERKNDLVAGRYELDAPAGETTVAVKITDMLGEEVLAVVTL